MALAAAAVVSIGVPCHHSSIFQDYDVWPSIALVVESLICRQTDGLGAAVGDRLDFMAHTLYTGRQTALRF